MSSELEVADIVSSTHEGKGIASTEGKKVFVRGAITGEKVRFKRRKKRRNYDEAELIEIIKPSNSRIEPQCDFFNLCGGCSLQHIDIVAQRALKENHLKESLIRIGSVKPTKWLNPIFDKDKGSEWNYRRKARLAVKYVKKKERVLVGFREKFAPFIVDMNRCDVLKHPINMLITPLSQLIGSLSIYSYLPQVEVAIGDNQTELVFRLLQDPDEKDKIRLIEFGKSNEIRISIQRGGPDSIELLYADDPSISLYYLHKQLKIKNEFKSSDFIQVNGNVNELTVMKVMELLDLKKNHVVVDLFCGIGNFTIPIAQKVKKVIGIEYSEDLVHRARQNSSINNIHNADFICDDLESVPNKWKDLTCDRLLLDPSRNGALEVIKNITMFNPNKIVYVSCHPGTLARDSDILVNQFGYVLSSAGIIDMFPHTSHVESVAVFDRK